MPRAVLRAWAWSDSKALDYLQTDPDVNGKEVGVMSPGTEVGKASGWVDVPFGISAFKRENGEYLVFVEEDARGKVLMYRWKP